MAICLATVICLGAAASVTDAHHSYGTFFDLCTRLTIEGQVESVQWKSPHVWLDVKTDDGTVHHTEWTGPQNLERDGVRPDSVKAGDRILVTGSPFKDPAVIRQSYPAFKGDSVLNVISALTQVRRPSDGWNWTGGPPSIPPECAARGVQTLR
jgi:hypothetical protein